MLGAGNEMYHVLVDAYGCNTARLDNLMDVYNVMNNILKRLSINAVMPIQLVPYYYCKAPEDVGISAFVLTEGGQLTIHTFPRLGCYFLDLLYDGFVGANVLQNMLKEEFPCDSFFIKKIDREEFDSSDMGNYDTADFGPHYMIKAKAKSVPTVSDFYHILDRIPYQVGMHPITRPCVVTDKVNEPNFLSGLIVIAESHIAMHYDYRTGEILMDIFSCKDIRQEEYNRMMDDLFGGDFTDVLIHRGRKHQRRQQTQEGIYNSFKDWQDYITDES